MSTSICNSNQHLFMTVIVSSPTELELHCDERMSSSRLQFTYWPEGGRNEKDFLNLTNITFNQLRLRKLEAKALPFPSVAWLNRKQKIKDVQTSLLLCVSKG